MIDRPKVVPSGYRSPLFPWLTCNKWINYSLAFLSGESKMSTELGHENLGR